MSLQLVFLQFGPVFVSVAPELCWPAIEDRQGPGCSVTGPLPCPRLAKSWSALSVGPSQPNCSTTAPGMGDLPAPITTAGAELRPAASCVGRLGSSWGPVSKAAPAAPRQALHTQTTCISLPWDRAMLRAALGMATQAESCRGHSAH